MWICAFRRRVFLFLLLYIVVALPCGGVSQFRYQPFTVIHRHLRHGPLEHHNATMVVLYKFFLLLS